MRAYLDANIFISYLLSPTGGTPPSVMVEQAFANAYTLLLSNGLITELREKVSTKPYLTARISQTDLEQLLTVLVSNAEKVPEITEELPHVGRNRKDDYLFAHAVVGQADYLVSGDAHVLSAGAIGTVRIVSPAQFLEILRESGSV